MHRLIVTLLAATALVLSGSAFAEPAIVIKFSHVVAEDTPKGRAAAYFAKLVEQRTKGRVKIQVYPNSQLYKDSDEIVALQKGANKPLRKPDDMKGLKMRVQPSAVLQAQMRTLGAIPETMDFSAAYQALKSGAVDGTENPASNFYTQQMQDVQKHLSLTHHGYLGYAVIVNRKFWDGLPADIRANLTEALRDATIFANDIALGANIDALEAIERSGKTQVIRLSPQERVEWKKALVAVHREMESRIGKNLIQSVYKETGFSAAKP